MARPLNRLKARPSRGRKPWDGCRPNGFEGRGPSGFLIAHVELFSDKDKAWSHVVVDHIRVWRPQDRWADPVRPGGGRHSAILSRFPTVKTLSFDQYGSLVTVSRLRTRLGEIGHGVRVRKHEFTERSNMEWAERTRIALGMGLVHGYRDTLAPMAGASWSSS